MRRYFYCKSFAYSNLTVHEFYCYLRTNGVEVENLIIQECEVVSKVSAGINIYAPDPHTTAAGEIVDSISFKVSL